MLFMPWQYRMLFYILSLLGSISLGLACYSLSQKLNWQVEQTETCRSAGSERYLLNMLRRFQILQVAEYTQLASAQIYLQKNSCQKFRKNNVTYAAPTDIRIDFTSMISHVNSYAQKYMISANFFSQANLQQTGYEEYQRGGVEYWSGLHDDLHSTHTAAAEGQGLLEGNGSPEQRIFLNEHSYGEYSTTYVFGVKNVLE